MILRLATGEDRDAVVELAMHFYRSTPYASLLTVDREFLIAQFIAAMEHGVVLVAETEHPPELVGFLVLIAAIHALSGDRFAEEIGWWVEPAHRYGTLGPQLLRRAEEWARANGCVFLKMIAPEGSDVGRFYEQQGYRAIETAYFKRVA